MAKLAALILVLASTALSGGEVTIPFPSDSLIPSTGLNSFCTVRNEKVIGWFKGNVKIGVVPSRNDVKDKPAVVITAVNQFEKNVVLIFPKGTPVSAGGRYKCKGEQNEEFLDVKVRFNLDSLQRQQSLSLGKTEKIVLGADAYPFAKFKWKKDGVAIDFAANPRLTLKDDGSISIVSVRPSDAGRYDVNINWEKRTIVNETITLDVYAKPLLNSQGSPSPVYSFVGNPKGVLIRCVFSGYPDPSVEISKDGSQLASGTTVAKLNVFASAIGQFGDYFCNATNSHGQASHTVKLVQADRPGKPTKVKAERTCNSIVLTWQPPLSEGGMRILNYVITANINRTDFRPRNVNEDKRTHKIDIVFQPESNYTVRIQARNGVGVSESEIITVTTDKYCKPGPPTISFIGGSRTYPDLTVAGPDVMVQWNAPHENGFDENLRYRVEWRIRGNSKQTWNKSEEVQEKQFKIKDLENGKHEIKVYAVNRAGKGNADVRVVNVKVSEGNSSIINSSKNKTVTKGEQIRLICNVTSHLTPNISWSKAGGNIKPGYASGKMLVIPYANQSDAGKYICTAKNAYGGQVFMKSVKVFVTVKFRSHPPINVSAQITELSIKVHWKKPESHGYPVLMYSVHRVDLDEAGQEVTSRAYHVNEDVHQYEVGDIVSGKSYKFYVTAWNTHGESVKDHSKSIAVNVQQP